MGVHASGRVAPSATCAANRFTPPSRLLCEEGLRSLCAVPLVRPGTECRRHQRSERNAGPVHGRDGDFLRDIANQVALAVANMQAYEEIAALKAKLEAENVYLQEEIRTEHNFDEIVGKSPALLACCGRWSRSRPPTPPCSFSARPAPARS